MADLEFAIQYATRAHLGQMGRDGQPYILHPLRVMLRLASETERIVAMLHDVVEKTTTTLDDLRRAGFADEVVAAVDTLTRREGESYEDLVNRAAAGALTRAVKLADVQDHLDLRHNGPVTPDDVERLDRAHRAWHRLIEP